VQWLLTFLDLWDPMEWLTVGLVLFAGAQVFAQGRTEDQRKRERKTDRERADDLAFQLAWAEQFRIDGLADEWDREDLVSLSSMGVLDPADVLPRDWTAVISALVSLSVESGYLGGVAITLAHDTARRIAMLNSLVADVIRKYPEDTSLVDMAATVRGHHPETIASLETQIRTTTRDLSRLLFDSLRQSPRADLFRQMNFRDDMRSMFGQRAVLAIKQREGEAWERAKKRHQGLSRWSRFLQRVKRRT